MKLKSVFVAALAAAFVFVGCDKNELTDPNKGDGTEQTDPNNPSDPSNPDGTDPEDPNNPGGENPGGENPENPTLPGTEISIFDFAQLPNSDQTLYRISGHVWTVDVDDDQTLVILANCLYDEDNFDPTKHAVIGILNPTWLNNLNPALRPGHVLTVAGSKGTFGEDPDGEAIILNSQYVSHVDYSEPYLVFDMHVKPYLGSEAGEYTFNVYSNTDWTITAPEGTTVIPASGNGCAELTFTYPANAKLEDMFYPLAFSYSGKTVELKFQQQALRYSLELSQYNVEVAAESTVASVDVLSNGAWTVIAPEGVTATPASGEGNATVNFTFAENKTRDQINYNVKITGGDVICDFIISQAPYEGLLALTIAEFLDAAVSTEYYQLTGIMSGTYNTTYGNFYLEDETGKVLVYGLTATQQTSNDMSFASLGLRDGDTLTLIGQRADYNGTAQVGGPAYYVSHVAAPYVDFAIASATVEADVTTYSIEFESNVAWAATASEGVTVSPASGEGDGSVVMTFAANTSNDPIDYTVTFTSSELTKTFTLTQKGVPADGAEPRYVKVTAVQEDWSGKYLIVFGNNAHATLSGKDLIATKAVSVVAGEIAATSDLDAAVMTVSKEGGKYVMKYPDGKYFSMAKNSSSSSTSPFELTFTYTTSGVKIAGVASGTTYILYHNSSSGNYYRCYVDKNGQSGYNLPTLYKYTE